MFEILKLEVYTAEERLNSLVINIENYLKHIDNKSMNQNF